MTEHNRLFETFVEPGHPPERQVEGLIAYGLYKKSKWEWAKRIHDREQRSPTSEELKAYIDTWTESQVEGKQTEAGQVLAQFTADFIESARPGIREEALRGRFWNSVWQAILANFIYTLILIAIVIVLAIAGIDVLGLIDRIRS